MTVVPFTWPVGMGKTFRGVFDRRTDQMRVFAAGEDRRGGDEDVLAGLDNPESVKRFGAEFEQARDELELVAGASPAFEEDQFLAGKQTPMLFGSAVNNFGVREVLDALVDLAPPPGDRPAIQRVVHPEESKFSGVVFKIQANMDPAHRDRIAFVRVASGHFERGMKLKVVRSGKDLRPNTVVSFLSQRRELLDEAFAGDIIGIPNHGVLQLGDTLTEGESLQFTGLPFFAPEIIRSVEVADPLRSKQLRAGLTQLGEEGAIQVFRPRRRLRALARRGGPAAIRSGGAPAGARIWRQGPHHEQPLPSGALGHVRTRRRWRHRTQAIHRRQQPPRGPGRGRRADPAGGPRRHAACGGGQLAEDQIPRHAGARGAGVRQRRLISGRPAAAPPLVGR